MDAEKRKRDDEGEIDGKKAKLEDDNGAVVTEEVEEFFAILRRMHVAARQFGKPEGAAGRKLATTEKLRLSFEARDFEEEKRPEADSGLDLNSDPASEES